MLFCEYESFENDLKFENLLLYYGYTRDGVIAICNFQSNWM